MTYEVEVPIGESDIELFKEIVYDDDTIEWIFLLNKNGDEVKLIFIQENEDE